MEYRTQKGSSIKITSANTLKIMEGNLLLSLILRLKDEIQEPPDLYLTFLKLEMQHAHEIRMIPVPAFFCQGSVLALGLPGG